MPMRICLIFFVFLILVITKIKKCEHIFFLLRNKGRLNVSLPLSVYSWALDVCVTAFHYVV